MADNTILNSGSGGDTIETVDTAGVKTQVVLTKAISADYGPGYQGVPAGQQKLTVDPDGQLITRSAVYTDERGYRVNFANSSLAVSIGNCTFTAASTAVTGTGFLTADLRVGDYVKVTADAESAWAQVASINSDTSLTLEAAYSGTGGSGVASSRAIIKPATGTGGSIAVASGVCTLTSGTTAGSIIEIERDVDWLPLVKQSSVTISQRIANQSIYIGFYDELHPTTPYFFAWFLADGTTNTTVKCQSARNPTGAPSASEIEETTVTIPNGKTTAVPLRFRTEVLGDRVNFMIEGTLVATHYKSMPSPRDFMTSTVRILNGTTPASTTTVTVDYDTVVNHNKLQVGLLSDFENVVATQAPSTPFTYSVAGVIAINTDLLIIDCSQFRSLSIQCTSMGTAGVVTPAWSNDNTTYVNGILQTAANGAGAATFNAAGLWTSQVYGRYLRLRLTTATTAGTTTLAVQGFQDVIGAQVVSQNTAANLQATVTATNLSTNIAQFGGSAVFTAYVPGGGANPGFAVGAGAGSPSTESASSAKTATGNTGVIGALAGACGAHIVVSSVTGTTPTLDVVLQESHDGGTTFVDIYHCERLTAAGTLTVPPVQTSGKRRWVWNISGTTPSFTFAIIPYVGAVTSVPKFVQFIDRTAGLLSGTLNATSSTYQVAGCGSITASITIGAATTGGTYKLQGSHDGGTNWFDLSSTVVAVASSTVQVTSTAGIVARHARVICSSAATGQTGTQVCIAGVN